jgi:hypothetical protein
MRKIILNDQRIQKLKTDSKKSPNADKFLAPYDLDDDAVDWLKNDLKKSGITIFLPSKN